MNFILFDAHGLAYYTQQGSRLTVNERQVQAIFGFIKTVRKYVKMFDAVPIVLWDGDPVHRQALYKGYKAKRTTNKQLLEMRKQFKQQKPDIQHFLSLMGVLQVKATDGEADDLAAILKAKLKPKTDHLYLYTGDKDWLQLIDEQTSVIYMREDRIIKQCHFGEETGYSTANQFIQAKALQGDASDEIAGVGGIGETGAMELLTEFGTVEAFVDAVINDEVDIKDIKSRSRKKFFALADNAWNEKQELGMYDIFKRNVQLIDLNNTAIHPKHIETTPGQLDDEGFIDKCHSLSFLTITDMGDLFLRPFRRG